MLPLRICRSYAGCRKKPAIPMGGRPGHVVGTRPHRRGHRVLRSCWSSSVWSCSHGRCRARHPRQPLVVVTGAVSVLTAARWRYGTPAGQFIARPGCEALQFLSPLKGLFPQPSAVGAAAVTRLKRETMKTMLLAAAAAMSLGIGPAFAADPDQPDDRRPRKKYGGGSPRITRARPRSRSMRAGDGSLG